MKYQEWHAKQQQDFARAKAEKLFKIGLYEETEVNKLPDLEILADDETLVFFKKDDNYGFYEVLTENNVVYGYKLYLIEHLTDEQYLEVTTKAKKKDYGIVGKVIEAVGWTFSGISLIIFLVVFFTAISTSLDFLLASFYAGSYFIALVIGIVIIAIGRSIRCKDIS